MTPEHILKKLKPTKAFAPTPENMEAFARYVIDVGPAGFVENWLAFTSAKPVAKGSKTTSIDPRVADLTARLTKVAKTTMLTSPKAAVAFINFSREADSNLPEPPAAAKKGLAPAVHWLVSQAGVDVIEVRLSSFEEQFA